VVESPIRQILPIHLTLEAVRWIHRIREWVFQYPLVVHFVSP
jgi:hypothetical protein